jgi:S1-C subfamily serine protease
MRFAKLAQSIRQFSSYVLTIFLGVVLTFSSLWVLPSQAEPAPKATVDQPALVPQRQSPAGAAIGSSSFVAAAVNRVGPAVVRIDTERTVSHNRHRESNCAVSVLVLLLTRVA